VGVIVLTSAAAVNMTYDISVNGSDAASSSTSSTIVPLATSVVPAKSGASRSIDAAVLSFLLAVIAVVFFS